MPIIVVHGGAAAVPDVKEKRLKLDAAVEACRQGFSKMKKGMTAVDAVEAAVNVMENNPLFNAGYGSALTIDGEVECDALIIDGKTMSAGAVASVTKFANPVSVARLVMEKSDHCLFSAEGAHEFGRKNNVFLIDPKSLIHPNAIERLQSCKKSFKTMLKEEIERNGHSNGHECGRHNGVVNRCHDTVGAVAIDDFGDVAAATSTGGLTAKQRGRVGDSPCIGSGGWADNYTAAVSTTGHGESIMKVCLAKHIANLVVNGIPIQKATQEALEYMEKRVNGYGGAIAIDAKGNVGIYCTTSSMIYAYIESDYTVYCGSTVEDRKIVPFDI